eukprot:gene4406-8766_t
MEFSCASTYYISTILEDKNCIVKKSWIKEAEYGLFAGNKIRKGQIIGRYTGKELTTSEAIRLLDKSYLMRLGPQCYIDSKDSFLSLPRFINDCRNKNGYNVTFLKSINEKCAWVISLRDIERNEEFFVDYGRWYWLLKKPAMLSTANIQHLICNNK